MNPGNLNLSVLQGDTYLNTFTWTSPAPSDPSGRTPGTPIDLTGATCVLDVANQQAFSSTAASANGSTITLGGTAGTIVVSLTPADTSALTSSLYALRITFPNETVSTILTGLLEVTAGVS